MRIFFTGFLYLALLAFSYISAQAKDWRGIIPLKSTRSDVVRILGRVEMGGKYRAYYNSKEISVKIIFTDLINEVSENSNLPADKVYQIMIEPRILIPLTNLKLDLTTYKKFDPAEPKNSGYDGYINKDEGLAVLTIKGNIYHIDYFPDARRQKLCPNCYDDLEGVRMILCGGGFKPNPK